MQGDIKSKPILFNTAMVQAILDGRKTMTRRVVKPQLPGNIEKIDGIDPIGYLSFKTTDRRLGGIGDRKAPYKRGDILWVRETIYKSPIHGGWRYLDEVSSDSPLVETWKKIPSIHMPKEAARIFLRVTDVRVERLQEIDKLWSNYDKEGMRNKETENISIAMKERFINIWDSTIKKKDIERHGWDANPWVWVVEFERCENAI